MSNSLPLPRPSSALPVAGSGSVAERVGKPSGKGAVRVDGKGAVGADQGVPARPAAPTQVRLPSLPTPKTVERSPAPAQVTLPPAPVVKEQERSEAPAEVALPALPEKRKRKPTKNIRLTHRDRVILDYLWQFGVATSWHVLMYLTTRKDTWTDGASLRGRLADQHRGELVQPTLRAVEKNLARLAQAGLVRKTANRSETIYSLTTGRSGSKTSGQQVVDKPLPLRMDPNSNKVPHAVGIAGIVNAVRVGALKPLDLAKPMHQLRVGWQWDADGSLVAAAELDPDEMTFLPDGFMDKAKPRQQNTDMLAAEVKMGWKEGKYGDPKMVFFHPEAYIVFDHKGSYHIPDLAVIGGTDYLPVAVELERELKGDEDYYRRRFAAYNDSPYGLVHYFTYDGWTHNKLTEIANSMRTPNVLIQVHKLDKKMDQLYTEF